MTIRAPFLDTPGWIALRIGRLLDVEAGAELSARTLLARDGRFRAAASG
jgi:hypothetical protein